jgi:hypothetical protein
MRKRDKRKKLKLDDGQLLLTVTDKRQARPLVSEGAQRRQHSKIQTELISGRKSQGGLDAKTYWLTVSRNVTSDQIRGFSIQVTELVSSMWRTAEEWFVNKRTSEYQENFEFVKVNKYIYIKLKWSVQVSIDYSILAWVRPRRPEEDQLYRNCERVQDLSYKFLRP